MGFFQRFKLGSEKKLAEQRRHIRIRSSLRVSYQAGNSPPRSDCRSKNISEGGIRISLYQKLEAGTVLKLCIYFQDLAEPAVIFGKVVWARETPGEEYPCEAGIAFDLFDLSLRDKIQKHLQTVLKE